ncbi:hypothetical protein [Spiribacter roseus]|uniref:capsular polysaccharide export protein, LipB/KpsS family n=1 Tax=Spiribacter roseus TaxID=1855875 RepID=UPI00132F94E4|nr:hypothetical protein [Spiribacter roseus]
MRALLYESSDNLREIKKYINDHTDLNCVYHICAGPHADLHVHDWDQPNFEFSYYGGYASGIYSIVRPKFAIFVDMYCRNLSPKKQNLYRNWTYHKYLNVFNILLDEISRVLIENQIEIVVFQRIPHLGSDYLLYVVAHALQLKVVILQQCPSAFGERFFLFSDIDDFGLFSSSINFGESVALPEINWGFEHSWEYMKQIEDFSERLKRIKSNRFSLLNLEKTFWHFFGANAESRTTRRYKKLAKEKEIAYLETINKTCSVNPELGGPFVYFPLHLQPEMTTSSLGGDFTDQALALERLHDILPQGWRILVKENPKQTAFMRDEAFFCRLRRLESVILVHPRVSTVSLLKNCSLVATITGTAGWEALLAGKPTLVFGKPWYRSLEGVFEYSGSIDIKTVSDAKPTRRAIESGLNELARKTGSGRVYGSGQRQALLHSKENGILVAQSLQKYIRETNRINGQTPCL